MVTIRGIELELQERPELLSAHIFNTKDFYESEALDFIRDNYPIHKTIIDVGANIGNHAVYFANFLLYERIVCFEPQPQSFKVLERNIAPYPNTKAYEAAIGNFKGEIGFITNNTNMGASSVHKTGSIIVPIFPLDTYEYLDVTLLKIDVEHYEQFVIFGALDTISRDHPLILIEGVLGIADYVLVKDFGWETRLYEWKGD